MSVNASSALPADRDPLPHATAWLDAAVAADMWRNPLAMALATADTTGRPAVRMVLLKHFDTESGFATIYTNYASRKGRELAANPHSAGVLYWEQLGRQLRIEGMATRAPAADSDAYFARRPLASRINACVSEQSRPIAGYALLKQRMQALHDEIAAGADCPRPAHWGGYRIWLDTVEFWIEGADRFHERVRYTRELTPRDGGYDGGEWARTLLQP